MLNTIFTSADCVAAELPQLPTNSDHGHWQLAYPRSSSCEAASDRLFFVCAAM